MRKQHVLAPLIVVFAVVVGAYGLLGPSMAPAPQAHAETRAAQYPRSPSGLLPYEQNTVDIVNKYGPSVVAVNVVVRGQRVDPLANMPPQVREYFKQFGRSSQTFPQARIRRAAGSAFVIDEKGQLLTNFHVIAKALQPGTVKLRDGAQITVRFPNNEEELPVRVIGTNRDYDLALLELKDPGKLPENVTPIPIGGSSDVEVGQKAIAIGNPFNLQSTVTVGIISAIQRNQPALVSGVTIPFVQTDTAINPGSSGSPLLNSQGQLIGVNDAILAPNGTFAGVGFAIPADLVKETLPKLKKGGVGGVTALIPNRPRLGVTAMGVSDYPDDVSEYLDWPEHGAVVVGVAPGGPADEAGLQSTRFMLSSQGREWPTGGDIIIAADGQKLESVRDLQKIVLEHEAGETIELTVWRNGETRAVDVTLQVIKDDSEQSQNGEQTQ